MKAQKSETVVRHKVKKGDTLASLARKYDISSTEIKKVNHLQSDKLKTGQTLRIEKDAVEPNREQKQDNRGDNKKGHVKASTKSAIEKTTDTPALKTYTVKKGDSLNKIARENNMTLDKVRQLNNLGNDGIYPGQVVQVK